MAGGGIGLYSPQAHASAACAGQVYQVESGDTLGSIASRYGTTWQVLASSNALADPNMIYVGQGICISGQQTQTQAIDSAPQNSVPVNVQGNDVAGMISQVFGSDAPGALQIARCESGLNPAASNPYWIGGSHAAGLFQILYPSTWQGTSQAAQSPYDAMSNIIAAHDIFVRDGHSWREWVCQP